MKKIPSVFKRDYEGDRLCIDEVVEGCEWVLAGEGIATEKFDGSPCLLRDGKLFRRYDRKPSKKARRQHKEGVSWKAEEFKSAPDGWEPCEIAPNFHTGHWPGWVPINGDDPADKYHVEGFNWLLANTMVGAGAHGFDDGTFELVGLKVQGNPYSLMEHQLWRHGSITTHIVGADMNSVPGTLRTFKSICKLLRICPIEGVVFHHPDGRMAKMKRRDIGLSWPALSELEEKEKKLAVVRA